MKYEMYAPGSDIYQAKVDENAKRSIKNYMGRRIKERFHEMRTSIK